MTRCSSVNANDQNIQKESCGLAITFSVVFSLITAFGIAGVYQAARAIAQTKRADVHSLDVGKEFKVLASTHTANDWIPGWVSVTQNLGTVLDDEGEEWTHYAMNHTHRDSGMTHSAILKYHAVSLAVRHKLIVLTKVSRRSAHGKALIELRLR